MSERSTSSSSGPGFITLLTLLFIALKLTGFIDWSWWWVLAPLWIGIPFAIFVVLLVFAVPFLIQYWFER